MKITKSLLLAFILVISLGISHSLFAENSSVTFEPNITPMMMFQGDIEEGREAPDRMQNDSLREQRQQADQNDPTLERYDAPVVLATQLPTALRYNNRISLPLALVDPLTPPLIIEDTRVAPPLSIEELIRIGVSESFLRGQGSLNQEDLDSIYLHFLETGSREELRLHAQHAEPARIALARITSGKDAAEREDEAWAATWEGARIARAQEREKEANLIKKLEQEVQSATQKIGKARKEHEQAWWWNKKTTALAGLQAMLEWIMAETTKAREIAFLEFKQLRPEGREKKIHELQDQIQVASANDQAATNEHENKTWKEVASHLEKSSTFFINAINAYVLGKHEVAKRYLEIANTYQKAADYKTKAVQAPTIEVRGANVDAALATERCIDNLIKSVTCLEKKEQASLLNNPVLVDSWDQVTLTYHRAADYDIASAHCYLEGSEPIAKMFGWGNEGGWRRWGASWCIKRAAENLEKSALSLERISAAEASEDTNMAVEIIDTLRQLFSVYQEAANYCLQAADAYARGRAEEGDRLGFGGAQMCGILRWYRCGLAECTELAAEQLEKRIEALNEKIKSSNNQDISNAWYQIAEIHKKASNYYTNFVNVYKYVKRTTDASSSAASVSAEGATLQSSFCYFKNAAEYTTDAIKSLRKKIEFLNKKETSGEAIWDPLITLYQTISERECKTAEATASREPASLYLSTIFRQVTVTYRAIAFWTEKKITSTVKEKEFEALGNPSRSNQWHQVAEGYQQALAQAGLAITAYEAGNLEGANCLLEGANPLLATADALVKELENNNQIQ